MSNSNLSRLSKFAIAGAAAIGLAGVTLPREASAATPGICPQFVMKYCVYDSSKRIFTAETNPCFAKQRHWTVIYRGQCRFR